jgi:TRAP-type C4-dicarboxylate transport system permease small subunit
MSDLSRSGEPAGGRAGEPVREPARPGGLLASLTGALAILGGLFSLAAAILVTISITGRWLGFGGISGDFELVQIATALSVFCFLPLTQWRRGNIMVDTFTTGLSPRTNRTIDAAWDLVFAAVMGLLAYCLVLGTREAFTSGVNSMVLGVPLGPVFALCAALVVILSLTAIATGLALLRRRA